MTAFTIDFDLNDKEATEVVVAPTATEAFRIIRERHPSGEFFCIMSVKKAR